MKCDELKAYRNLDVAFNTARQTETVIAEDYEGYCIEFEEDDEVYLKDEVDAAIAELKAENEELKKKCEAEKSIGATFSKNGADLARWVEELRKEIESLKASHYAEMVDAGMLERRLQRALWLARAELCHRLDVDRYLRNHRYSWYNENCLTWADACVAMEVKMCNAESKCQAKAEEYK